MQDAGDLTTSDIERVIRLVRGTHHAKKWYKKTGKASLEKQVQKVVNKIAARYWKTRGVPFVPPAQSTLIRFDSASSAQSFAKDLAQAGIASFQNGCYVCVADADLDKVNAFLNGDIRGIEDPDKINDACIVLRFENSSQADAFAEFVQDKGYEASKEGVSVILLEQDFGQLIKDDLFEAFAKDADITLAEADLPAISEEKEKATSLETKEELLEKPKQQVHDPVHTTNSQAQAETYDKSEQETNLENQEELAANQHTSTETPLQEQTPAQ